MEWLDILRRIESGEGEQTEFKRGLGDLSSIGRTICAFANTRGGVIILGVSDSQQITGVKEDAESFQERLTSFLHTGCSSPVSARFGRYRSPSGRVHWIEVPHQRGLEPLRYDGRVWVRRERSSVEPSPIELQELYNAFGYILTEERTIQAALPSHIDVDAFRTYLRRMRLDIESEFQPRFEDDLRNRGVIEEIGGGLHPTLFGIMAFGKFPQDYSQTRSFIVQCVAYQGTDRASEVHQTADMSGRIDEQVRRAEHWIASKGRSETYSGLIRTDHPLLPPSVLREALVNAVVHRDYAITGSKILLEVFAEHVDITSPGGLPNHLRIESVRAGGHPRSRNELLANFMLVMGYMEQRGRGWPIMRNAMRTFNGTEPEIMQSDGDYVRVRFHTGNR